MSRPRRFLLTAIRDLPELDLVKGEVIRVDRNMSPPVTRLPPDREPDPAVDGCHDPAFLSDLALAVFMSRPRSYWPADKFNPAFTVTPSYIGAQNTLENLVWEMRGNLSAEQARANERRELRASVTAALARPVEVAPVERHAAALLGSVGYQRLARSLTRVRRTAPA